MSIVFNEPEPSNTKKIIQLVALVLLGSVIWISIITLLANHQPMNHQNETDQVHMDAKMYHELIEACLAGEELYLNGKTVKCVSVENR
jgi:hypothetical protein